MPLCRTVRIVVAWVFMEHQQGPAEYFAQYGGISSEALGASGAAKTQAVAKLGLSHLRRNPLASRDLLKKALSGHSLKRENSLLPKT